MQLTGYCKWVTYAGNHPPPHRAQIINNAFSSFGLPMPPANLSYGYLEGEDEPPAMCQENPFNEGPVIYINWGMLEEWAEDGSGMVDEGVLTALVGIALEHELGHILTGLFWAHYLPYNWQQYHLLHAQLLCDTAQTVCNIIELAKMNGDEDAANSFCQLYNFIKMNLDAGKDRYPHWDWPEFPDCEPCEGD